MIDTHSHLLYGLDDGCRDISESIRFARQAVKQGVTTLFATPHCCDGVFNCKRTAILGLARQLNSSLHAAGIPLRVLPGAEIRVNHDLIAEFDNGNLLTLNDAGTWMLLELPPMFIDGAVSMMIRKLRNRGVTPVIAHAERNPMIMSRPDLAANFIYQGARIQITAGSITGDFGKASMKTARIICEADQVFCIGSDIHPGRKYRMEKAEKRLKKWVGDFRTQMIFRQNPALILQQCNQVNQALVKSANPGKK